MASISQAKTIGGVGSILVLLSAIPSAGTLLAVVGFIMILLALKEISDSVADKSIFDNALIAIGLAIAGLVAGTLVIAGSVLTFMGLHGMTFASFGPNFNPSSIPNGDWLGLIGAALVGLAVVWLMLLSSSVFIRRSYGAVATKLNDQMFAYAGVFFLIGAATTIILVGFLFLFVAQALLAIAFFSISETRSPQ
jgi:uncharacterized membrane protein